MSAAFDHIDLLTKPTRIHGLPKDPQKGVVVKPSTLPGAGLGLFAAKDLATFDQRISRNNATKHKIAPYLGVFSHNTGEGEFLYRQSDYIISVCGVTVDSAHRSSCYARFANDSLCCYKDNVRYTLIDEVPWLVPLENVEILEVQELFIS